MELVLHSMRWYGEPKLTKPKELKGLKPAFNVDFIPKRASCQCFIVGDDIWVKHTDYFSEDTTGVDNQRKNKFIYNDSFGSVVFRNEAWMVVKDFQWYGKPWEVKSEILRLHEKLHNFEFLELEVGDWERFWDNFVNKAIKSNVKKEEL